MLHAALETFVERRLQTYEEDPGLIREHAGVEETVLAGGYGYQILELVQNGADAMFELRAEERAGIGVGRIQVLLRGSQLYVANTGAPLNEQGLDAILRSHSSNKRAESRLGALD